MIIEIQVKLPGRTLFSEEPYEGKMGRGIQEVDNRARQMFKALVRALRAVSPLSLDMLTNFTATFVGFSEEMVENVRFQSNDIPEFKGYVNKVLWQEFPFSSG